MTYRKTGTSEGVIAGGEAVFAFVPDPLPPANPPLTLDGPRADGLANRLRIAENAIADLNQTAKVVPNPGWFTYAFLRTEAVISSQIEGTQASLDDLLTFEVQPDLPPSPDLEEILNHLKALAYARGQLADPTGLPLSMRLLNKTHRLLMTGARGGNRQPGAIRRAQNWIGGNRPGNAVFVPPPPQMLADLLGDFEMYLHAEDELPALVRAGLLHVQFETIHPYLDGNGRIGRLLITLLLETWGLLQQPFLHLSLFFKRNRAEYYRRLNNVRVEGDWEGWLDFFLEGVATIAAESRTLAIDLCHLVAQDRERLLAGRSVSLPAIRLFEQLPHQPIVTVASAMRQLEVSKPTATRAINALEETGILNEVTGQKRDRRFTYEAYLKPLEAGTELNAGWG